MEHLSAAAIIHGVAGWHLEADHEDLPIFDGSARIWSLAFARLSDRAPVIEAPGSTLRAMGWKSERGGGIDVSPSDRFRMRVDWSDGPDGAEVWEGGTEELAGIVEARTFVNADDWIGARLAGLLKGADASSGRLMRGQNPSNDALVLARESGADPDSRVWIGGGTRMENECAAHKALDLVGDIGCWIGYLPKLSIHARDAGHDLHHLLGSALRGSIGEV